jgi:hypothetical protein
MLPASSLGKVARQFLRSKRKATYVNAGVNIGKYFLFSRIPRMINKNLSPYRRTNNQEEASSPAISN